MAKKKTAIVLGGTNPHIELIKQLKQRDYYVILVDYLANPPARSCADLHLQESTMDKEKVAEIGKEYNASLVISACVDQANITACYAAEKLGLTKPYSYKTASEITNKGFMKKIMWENGIPTTKFYYMETGDTLEDFELKFPVMVKPADSCAASGVKKANNNKELHIFLDEARAVSRTGRTVVEEFFSGIEVSAYCFVKDGNAKVVMVSERLSVIEGERKVLKCYATVTPPAISDAAMKKIEKAADGIAKAFALDNTPLHVQAIIDGDEISIIEFAPRVGGGISYRTIKENTGFDIISATIDSYLEQPVDFKFEKPEFYYSVNLLYAVPGVYDHVEGIEKMIDENVIEGIHYHKTKGMLISDDRASAGRVAAVLIRGNSRQDLSDRIKYVMENIKVYDEGGKDILRRDLYLKN